MRGLVFPLFHFLVGRTVRKKKIYVREIRLTFVLCFEFAIVRAFIVLVSSPSLQISFRVLSPLFFGWQRLAYGLVLFVSSPFCLPGEA